MQYRRFFQVSIRTLLIITTLAAVGMAYWRQILQRVREQKLATARILDLGGKTKIRPTGQDWPWVQELVGDEFFQEVVDIDLCATQVTDSDLEQLGKLRGVRSLSLAGAIPRTYGFGPPQLPSQISDSGIRRLGPQPNLMSAQLARTPIGDESLAAIALWSKLEVLDMRGTKITSDGFQRLAQLKRLKKLSLGDTKIDDGSVPTLSQMSTLQELHLDSTAISGEGLLRLREALPACKIDGDLWDHTGSIAPDPESMRWKEVTRPMWALSRAGDLKLLILADTAVTDAHLADLDRLENVEVIDLRRTKVTTTGVETLQRLLPNCKMVR